VTLREYLEKQINYWMLHREDFPEDHYMYKKFTGKVEAYSDVLTTCPPSVLNTKILDEVGK
jgi:hypothetical protein